MIDRRTCLLGMASLALAPDVLAAATRRSMPSLFFAHGAPFLARDPERGAALAALVAGLPRRPRAIVAVTPHVRAEYVSLAAHGTARHSFPRRFSERVGAIRYAPPAADALAAALHASLEGLRQPLAVHNHAGFNHTIWMGLLHMFPAADIPVVEMAMPFLPPQRLFELGRALAPLREEDVLVISSGSLTHNLASLFVDPTPTWALEFDQWTGERLAAWDIDAILDWRRKAPAAALAHPDDGAHFNVMLYALGAAADSAITHAANEGFEFGSFSTRDYLFG